MAGIVQIEYDIFISYGRGDDISFVEDLFTELTDWGYKVWFDKENMESRGLTFLQEIRDTLASNTIRVILVVGPHATASSYVEAEWKFALENCGIVIPILRLGGKEIIPSALVNDNFKLIPAKLSNYHCPDFSSSDIVLLQQAKSSLQRILEAEIPLPSLPVNFPLLPANYFPRVKDLSILKEKVMADVLVPTVITSKKQMTSLQGMGGVGKTVMANAFGLQCDVRRSFYDGVFWFRMGPFPNLHAIIEAFGNHLKENIKYLDGPQKAIGQVENLLVNKNCLLILDDVYDASHIEVFKTNRRTSSRILVTTRDSSVIESLGGRELTIDLLDDELAISYLCLCVGSDTRKITIGDLPEKTRILAKGIVHECGNLPLAIAMAAALIKGGDEDSWEKIYVMLRDAEISNLSGKESGYEYNSVYKAIDISIQTLLPFEQEMYFKMAVFPDTVPIPKNIYHFLWQNADRWEERHTDKLLRNYLSMSLVSRFSDGHYLMHDLQKDYVKIICPDIRALHRNLVLSFGDPYQLSLPYMWRWYIWHLMQAEEAEKARALLSDYTWLKMKLLHSDIYGLIADFEFYDSKDMKFEVLKRALQMSAHIISKDKKQFALQLQERLKHNAHHFYGDWLNAVAADVQSGGFLPIKTNYEAVSNLIYTVNHPAGLNCIISWEGKAIAAANDGSIIIVDPLSGITVQTLQFNNENYSCLAVSGIKLISASFSGNIQIWDLYSAKVLYTIAAHDCAITCLAASGSKVVSAGEDGSLKIWSLESGDLLNSLQGHIERINCLLIHEDLLYTGDSAGNILTWGMTPGVLINSFLAPQGVVRCMVISGDILVAAGVQHDGPDVIPDENANNYIVSWSIHTRKAYNFSKDFDNTINCILTDENRLFAGFSDCSIRSWDIKSGKLLHEFIRHSRPVEEMVIYEDFLVSQSTTYEGLYCVWDKNTGALLNEFKDLHAAFNSFTIVSGRVITASSDKFLKIWDIKQQGVLPEPGCHKLGGVYIFGVSGNKLISGGGDVLLRSWDLNTGKLIYEFLTHGSKKPALFHVINCLAVRGNLLVSGDGNYNLLSWNTETNALLHTFKGHSGYIKVIEISGDALVSGSSDHEVRTWNLLTGSPEHVFAGHDDEITCLAIADDTIMSGSKDHTVRVWDAATAECIHVLSDAQSEIKAIKLQGNRAIACTQSGVLYRWDIKTGKCLNVFKSEAPVNCFVIAGSMIICGCNNGAIGCIDISSGDNLLTFSGHSDSVTCLAIFEDKIISGSADHTIAIWDVRSRQKIKAVFLEEAVRTMLFDNKTKVLAAGNEEGYIYMFKV